MYLRYARSARAVFEKPEQPVKLRARNRTRQIDFMAQPNLCDFCSPRLMRPDEVPRLNQLIDDLVDLELANRAVPENLFDGYRSFASKIPNLLGHR